MVRGRVVDFFPPFLTRRGFKIWLTFSLDLKDTDGVLWRQVPELARRQCVSPLSQGADGRLQEEGLEERRTGDLMCHDGSVLQEVLEYFSGLFLCRLNFVFSVLQLWLKCGAPRARRWPLCLSSSSSSSSSHTAKWSSRSKVAACARASNLSKSTPLKWQTVCSLLYVIKYTPISFLRLSYLVKDIPLLSSCSHVIISKTPL